MSLSPWMAVLDRLDAGIDGGLAMEVGERVAQGEKLLDIARRFGVRRGHLRMWLEAKPERLVEYEAGRVALAEELAYGVLEKADECVEGQEGVKRLQMDARKWLSGKMDRGMWGERSIKDVNVTVSGDWGERLRRASMRVVGEGRAQDEGEVSGPLPDMKPEVTIGVDRLREVMREVEEVVSDDDGVI